MQAAEQFVGWSMADIRRLMGVLPGDGGEKLNVLERTPDELAALGPIPDEFDSRRQWPQCPSIGLIRDQSNCGRYFATSNFHLA